MQRLFQGNTEERARKRNLCISIVKHIAENQKMLESAYKTQEIAENFCFRQRDIKYYLTDFFCPAGNSQYCFQPEMRKVIEKFLEAHKRALPALDEARVMFLKTFGKFYYDMKKERYCFDAARLDRIYAGLHDTITILHWGQLPILNKWLMINSGRIPEENVVAFYDHYHMLSALMQDIQGNGENMTRQGDETLEHELEFSVYTRRHRIHDRYRIRRTVDGWFAGHISINGPCKKDGTGALIANLNHDCVFYPEDGLKYAMNELWEQAEEGELTLEQLQERLQQIADWVSAVERAVGDYQPSWVNYYSK